MDDKAKSIFLSAIDHHPPEQWDDYLDQSCQDDEQLRAEVQQLLRSHQQLGTFHEEPQSELTAAFDSMTEKPGTQIGPYKLREQIGEGGFGVVYVAEQEKPVARKVALKIIKPGMDTKDVIARFEAERQALALMDHPNIAKVLDAGTTDDRGQDSGVRDQGKDASESLSPESCPLTPGSRPYFVMELVHGLTITEFCDGQKLTNRQRLELFVDVCRAVQHAHQKGIIHRDIKPTNILVTMHDDQAVPKVIDFGVAKAISRKLTDKTVYTAYGQMVGTPMYMSPEQAQLSGLDVDTRSDVYSLGVLLYELLTGTTPFDKETLKEAGFDELRRIIREDDPPRPSDRVSTLNAELLSTVSSCRQSDHRKLGQSIRGELDWIVMKALEKDRNRRYESASAFAADVERFLNYEPVHACPPSMWYRVRKFVQRKKAAFAGAAVLGLALLVAIGAIAGSLGWMAHDRKTRQTRTTTQAEVILADVDRLMQDQNWPEALATARRAETLIADGDADKETRDRVQQVLDTLQLVRSLEDAQLAESLWVKGRFDYASADKAYARAFAEAGFQIEGATVEEAARELEAHSQIRLELAAALTYWARMRRKKSEGKEDESWRHLLNVADAIDDDAWRRSLRDAYRAKDGVAEKTLRELAATADVEKLPASSISILGLLLQDRVSSEEAVKLLLKAQQWRPSDFWTNYRLAKCFEKMTPRRSDEEVAYYRAALALRPDNIAVLNNLGYALKHQENLDEAIACYKRALEIDPDFPKSLNGLGVVHCDHLHDYEAAAGYFRRAVKLEPTNADFLMNLGNAYLGQRKLDEAISCYRSAIQQNPKDAGYHFNLSRALTEKGLFDEAVSELKQAMALDPEDADAYGNMNDILLRKGDIDEAIDYGEKAVELNPESAPAHYNLALALENKGKLEEAVSGYQRAIQLDPKFGRPHYRMGMILKGQDKLDEAIARIRHAIELEPTFAIPYIDLGNALLKQGKPDEGIECYRKAIEIAPNSANAWYNLGSALLGQQQLDEAVACFRKTIELNPQDAVAWQGLGNTHLAKQEVDEAIACFRKAIEIDPSDAVAWFNLGTVLTLRGEQDEAITCYRKAVEIDPQFAVAYYRLGLLLYERNQLDEAISYLRKAIELEPLQAEPQYKLGNAFHKQRKWQEAEAAYRETIKIKHDFPGAQHALGDVLYVQKRYTEAIDCFQKAIEQLPEFAKVHYSLGSAFYQLKKWEEAEAAYRMAIRIEAGNPLSQYYLGLVLYRQSKWEEAVSTLKRAAELRPQDAWSWQWLGWAQYQAGDWKDCLQSLENSSKLQRGGKGDCGQWIVMAQAHKKLAEDEELAPEEKNRHQAEAQRLYKQADRQIQRLGRRVSKDVRNFHAEAQKLLKISVEDDKPKQPRGKGDGANLPKRPYGCFAQISPVPFST